ncbi:hypothetical protein [Phytomonospora endophytica]|uniref:Uncharacterized protein n=1 Tax=Phytomonospora endophytica TaxID=714109 RepID=A0A841FPJ0_9ACTN|nr:hypothetical protein [Phytomonospora endophytica]MBB6037744.1 hypothetical protein [Phytomonospora endophytica]GIG67729.1 hypothetical protein Pen01_40240 [Phytomonospora endophytica]
MGNMLAIETRRATEEDHDTMRDHTIRRHRTTGHEELRENRFSPDWTACDPCAKLIDRYDANALASRVAKLLPSHPPQNVLKKLYRDFLRKKQPKLPALPNP